MKTHPLDLHELLLRLHPRVALRVLVRVPLDGELAVRRLDDVLLGAEGHAEDVVVARVAKVVEAAVLLLLVAGLLLLLWCDRSWRKLRQPGRRAASEMSDSQQRNEPRELQQNSTESTPRTPTNRPPSARLLVLLLSLLLRLGEHLLDELLRPRPRVVVAEQLDARRGKLRGLRRRLGRRRRGGGLRQRGVVLGGLAAREMEKWGGGA